MDATKLLMPPVECNVQIIENVSPLHTEDKESNKFENHNVLTIQIQTNTGKKSFPCDTCGKVFSLNGNLKVHKRSHTKERPFPCDLCDKAFTTSSKLTVHKNIHTGLKPYSCDICSKSFSQNSDLTGHKRIHTREIPFSCDVCNIKFTNSSVLMKHKLIHKEGKPCDEEAIQNADKLDASVYILEDSPGIKMEAEETKDMKEEIIINEEINFEEDPLSC